MSLLQVITGQLVAQALKDLIFPPSHARQESLPQLSWDPLGLVLKTALEEDSLWLLPEALAWTPRFTPGRQGNGHRHHWKMEGQKEEPTFATKGYRPSLV